MADKFMTTLNGYEIRDAYAREKLEELAENGVPGGSGNAGNGVSDWNQNDATGEGYIKNRPFYMTREPSETTSVVEILPETTVTVNEEGMGETVNPSGILFEIGKTYTVVWDGTTYDVECVMMEGIFSALCDPDLSFSNYPFAVVDYSPVQSGTIMVISIEPSSEHTVSVSMSATVIDLGEMYFESKYVSHLQPDWDNEDVTSVNYIKNKPFGTNGEVVIKLPEKFQNPADWSEMDETKGTYIANKPFGDFYTGNIIAYTGSDGEAVEFEQSAGTIYNAGCQTDRPLVEGRKYKVTIGSYVYDNVVCYADDTMGKLVIGSNELQMFTNSGEYPFMLASSVNSYGFNRFYINNYDGTPIAFSVEEYEVEPKTIDEKYIPDSIARVGVIDEQYIPETIMRTTDTIPKWNGYSLEVVTELPATPDETTFYVILES